MRKSFSIVMVLAMLLSLSMPVTASAVGAIAADEKGSADEIRVVLDGKELSFDVPPQIINGRTMVPMRKIFESLGLSVSWSDVSGIATASDEHVTIMIERDCDRMLVNCDPKPLDSPAVIINGRNLVPARAIAESMGCKVLWDDAERTVIISRSDWQPDNTAVPAILNLSDSEILDRANRMVGIQYGFLYGLRPGAVLEQDWSRVIKYNGQEWVAVKNADSMMDVQEEWNTWMSYFIPVPDDMLSSYRVINGRLYTSNMGIGDDILQGDIEITGIVKRSGDTIQLSGCSWRCEAPGEPYTEHYFTYMMKAKADGWYCTGITGESGRPWSFN